ncbi:MAG: helix-turn-helix domain-containing protein [Lachnospiraceae bacterium]|nr:helix-turn-helix domain-containing protein [Lachnospiraceae bacterium]
MKNYFDKFPDSYVESSRRIIATPSAFARSAFFYVQETGYLKLKESHLAKRKNLDSYLVVLVLSGKGTLMYDGVSYELSQGSCFFIDCNLPYYHQSSQESPWELLWVHFKGSSSQAYYEYFCSHCPPAFRPSCFGELKEKLLLLTDICQNHDLAAEIHTSRILVETLSLILLFLTAPSGNPSLGREKMTQVRAYLDKHFTEKFSLNELSSQFFISKYHLSREFKACYGITLNTYVITRRITLAKRLLRFTDYTLEEIAHQCGFYDASYFNKHFKKSEGISASDFRRKWIN